MPNYSIAAHANILRPFLGLFKNFRLSKKNEIHISILKVVMMDSDIINNEIVDNIY